MVSESPRRRPGVSCSLTTLTRLTTCWPTSRQHRPLTAIRRCSMTSFTSCTTSARSCTVRVERSTSGDRWRHCCWRASWPSSAACPSPSTAARPSPTSSGAHTATVHVHVHVVPKAFLAVLLRLFLLYVCNTLLQHCAPTFKSYDVRKDFCGVDSSGSCCAPA